MKPTLLVLAAGMGSRYGGLKQLDPMGPNGETLLDYSVYDALRAGFGSVTFVIRRDFEEVFKQQIGKRYESQIEVRYVFQGLTDLPGGYTLPEGREKPWGTTHAIWCAKDVVKEPFAAINADDFYGPDAYVQLAKFLSDLSPASTEFAMVGFNLRKTLSDHGTVSRGVCRVDQNNMLQYIAECLKIERVANGGQQVEADGSITQFTGDETVSMNFWGFTPAIFPMLEDEMLKFLAESGKEMKSECLIPNTVGVLVKDGRASLKVLETTSVWFGITYREDKPHVQGELKKLIDGGVYPTPLWQA